MNPKLKSFINFLKKIDSFIATLEGAIVVVILSFMLILGIYQVIARKLFQGGFIWGEVLLRNLVPWIGLLGASLASQKDKHIGIDVITRILPPFWKKIVQIIIGVFVVYVSFLFFNASLMYLKSEAGSTIIGIPSWKFQIIFPCTFILIIFHYAVKSILGILTLFKNNEDLKE